MVKPAVRLPQASPVRAGETCSDANTQAPGTSPPMAAPCNMRRLSNNTGAAKPIWENVGSRPMAKVGTAISSTLSMNIRLRPTRSPK